MSPREHHYLFAQHLLHKHVFEDTDKVFQELNGPMREAFLMFLWDSVAEVADAQLPPVDVGTIGGTGDPAVHKLDVLGVDRTTGWEIAVLSMPPTEAPTEAAFIAIARRGPNVRYFLYEHSAQAGRLNFTEKRADGTRINFGPSSDVSAQGLLRAIGAELGFDASDATVGNRPAKKKSSWILKGCLGCAVMMAGFFLFFVFGVGALVYLEEGRPLHDHTAEFASTEVVSGTPFMLEYDSDGTGYSHVDLWLVVPDDGPISVAAEVSCDTDYREDPELRTMSDVDYGAVREGGFVYMRLHDNYLRHRSGIVSCAGIIDATDGSMDGARVIVTKMQRPSDFFAF